MASQLYSLGLITQVIDWGDNQSAADPVQHQSRPTRTLAHRPAQVKGKPEKDAHARSGCEEQEEAVSMETMPGSGQSESVSGGNPDVRATLLLDDYFNQVVHLLKAVAVDDGYTHTHTLSVKLILRFRCVFTCKTLKEILFQFNRSI